MIPRVFIVTDRRLATDLVATIDRVLAPFAPGVAAVVLREKDLPVRDLLALARALRAGTRARGAKLVVSGRLDVALACEADGVHLGGEAPSVEEVRALVPASMLVGVSLHHDEVAPPSASYAFLSPIFATESKPGARPLGLSTLRECVANSPVPVVALGGIDETNAASCFSSGASGVALRGALLGPRGVEVATTLARAS